MCILQGKELHQRIILKILPQLTKGNSSPQDTASKFYLTEGGKSNNRGQCFKKIGGNVTQDGRIIQEEKVISLEKYL